ncbi:MAG: CapA family protein, partial [Lachnospiraceae bacterium]
MKYLRSFNVSRIARLFVLGLFFLCSFAACSEAAPTFSEQNNLTATPAPLSPTPTVTPAPTPTPTPSPTPTLTPTPTPRQVTLLAVGDDLVHGSTLNGGLQEDGTYDFNGFYRHLTDEISAADIAVINQETILGGAEFEYSGYPRFNAPDAMGDAIVNAGFDVVLHATNHTMDK